MSKVQTEKKGFTTAEKWIIWAVFCALLGLSTYRFSVFTGLMLLSAGVFLLRRKQRTVLACALSLVGVVTLAFSKFLI